jgi:hypothetical protein
MIACSASALFGKSQRLNATSLPGGESGDFVEQFFHPFRGPHVPFCFELARDAEKLAGYKKAPEKSEAF